MRTHTIALAVSTVALAAAGCGSSSSSSNTTRTAPPASVVARGNAPVKLTFSDPGYPAACEKSLETPNGKGDAFNTAQAKAYCGCLQQQAQSQGLASQSEQSIKLAQFRSLFSTCLAQLRAAGATTTT